MATFANITPSQTGEHLTYALNSLLPAAEGDVFNQSPQPNPASLVYSESFLAVVTFTAQGPIQSSSAYVVAQTDMGDGVWIDVAWCVWNGASGSATFALSGGAFVSNSFQQRASGSAPSSNGSNQMNLGGRLRFVGKASINATSSSSSSSGVPGVNPGILVTIQFRPQTLR